MRKNLLRNEYVIMQLLYSFSKYDGKWKQPALFNLHNQLKTRPITIRRLSKLSCFITIY